MVSIPVGRDIARDRFTSRAQYYKDGPARHQGNTFCKIVEKSSPRLLQGFEPRPERPLRHVPWVTLVVGSGCLEMPDDPRLNPESVEAGVKAILDRLVADEAKALDDEIERDVSTIAQAGIGARFARALVRDRLQLTAADEKRLPEGDPPVVTEAAARLVLLSGLLTRLYFAAKASAAEPLGRWDADVANLSKAGNDANLDDLQLVCRWHCERAIEALDTDAPPTMSLEIVKGITDLLARVNESLAGSGLAGIVRLDLGDVRLVTEASWYVLTIEEGAYPGWTELLFGLVLREPEVRIDHSRPRPVVLRGREQSEPIVDLLQNATIKSWQTNNTNVSSRDRFYRAAATVLWAQATAVIEAPAGAPLPPASAFVTSFDIELEMATWRIAPPGSSFFVVVPVHVFKDKKDRSARPCWLRAEVVATGDGELSGIRRPIRWDVLQSQTPVKELKRGPHIIHLSGAPLIHLPGSPGDDRGAETVTRELGEIASELANLKIGLDVDQIVQLEHAITTDEYLALRQAEVELLLAASESSDADDRRNRGLPTLLTTSSSDQNSVGDNPRFWAVMGVPINDPAIRHRLVSQLSPRRFDDGGVSRINHAAVASAPASEAPAAAEMSEDPNDPFGFDDVPAPAKMPTPSADDRSDADQGNEHPTGEAPLTGMVVNSRVTNDEAHLMYWMGFDVIRDSAGSFTTDLEHYAAHLRAGLDGWPNQDRPCDLPTGGAS